MGVLTEKADERLDPQCWGSVGQIEQKDQEEKEIQGTSENKAAVVENESQIGMRIPNGINPTARRKRAERLQDMVR